MEFSQFKVTITDILTTLELLLTPDDTTSLSALYNINCYIEREKILGLMFLETHGVIFKILQLFARCDIIARYALKILLNYMEYPGFYIRYRYNSQLLVPIIDLFIKSNDVIIQECTTYLIKLFCTSNICANYLCRCDMVQKLFEVIVTTTNLDILLNSIQIIHMLMNTDSTYDFVCMYAPCFSFQVLNNLLRVPLIEIRAPTLNILKILIKNPSPTVQVRLYETRTVLYLITCLEETYWNERQVDIMNNIYICCAHYSCEMMIIESSEFLHFIEYSKTASTEHMSACLLLVKQFMITDEAQQAMLDLDIPRQLEVFCKCNCTKMQYQLCQIFTDFCEEKSNVNKIVSVILIDFFADIVNTESNPWVPYRLAPIKLLHTFLLDDPKLKTIYFKCDVLRALRSCLIKRSIIGVVLFDMVVDMILCLITDETKCGYIFSKAPYEVILQFLNDANIEYVKKGLIILKATIHIPKYKMWFYEAKTIDDIKRIVFTEKGPLINTFLEFVDVACDDACLALWFRMAGFIPPLEEMGNQSAEKKGFCDNIISKMYGEDLSFTFFEKSYLSAANGINNGFFTYTGRKPEKYPENEKKSQNDKTDLCTILQVDLMNAKNICQNDIIQQRLKIFYESNSSILYKNMATLQANNSKVFDKLNRFLSSAVDNLNEEHSIIEKVKYVANFVHTELTLKNLQSDCMSVKHRYGSQIFDYKACVKVNHLPLSKARVGGLVEKSLLFKVLADIVGLPCSLHRNSKCFWNEVPICYYGKHTYGQKPRFCIKMNIVDLFINIGDVMPRDGLSALYYVDCNWRNLLLLKNQYSST